MKKILSIVLSLLLVCSLAPISAFAASEEQSTEKVCNRCFADLLRR